MKGLIIFTALVLTASLCGAVLPVNGEVGLYDKVIRLHVIANSDSDEDQELKLAVRDSLLDGISDILSGASDVGEAKKLVEENAAELTALCEKTVAEEGFDYPVGISLGYERYPEREYEGTALPAGDYYSVRVTIGEAAGRNWWCVLFPPLCVGAASERESVMASAGLTRGQIDVMTDNGDGKYVLKFRVVEFLRRVFCSN